MPAHVLIYSSSLAQRFSSLAAVRRFLGKNTYVVEALHAGRVQCFPLQEALSPDQVIPPPPPPEPPAPPVRDPFPARMNTGQVVHWVIPRNDRFGDVALCNMGVGQGSGWHVVNTDHSPDARDTVTCIKCRDVIAE